MESRLNRTKIVEDFREMIRKRTVSCEDMRRADLEEFAAFRQLLLDPARFPGLAERAEYRQIGPVGMLFKIPGFSAEKPSVLMAHYDVVPADQEDWVCDPFGAELRDGRIFGRGTLDTKGTLCSIVEAVDAALAAGWTPKNDLYLSFGGEEEVSGATCAAIVDYLTENGVRPDFVLDEGGAVIPEGLPGLKKKAAMIGIAEKGAANYMLSVRGTGGHAATPPRHTAVGRLAKAAVRIENHPFPARLSSSVRLMFREVAKEVPFYEKFAFAHPELLSPAIKAMATYLGGTFNAMVRTTAAVVIFEGRSAFNVLPDRAAMGVNVRLLEGDTTESAAEYLRKVIRDPEVEVQLIAGTDPSPTSKIDCPQWETLCRVIRSTWPDAVTAPQQLNGGTDSRFYAAVCDYVYRFSPMEMTAAERKTTHNANESISVANLLKTVVFYTKLIREL